ncbi:MAG: VCBS repeat-containing protein, partial [candidate division WOR-3 bacterium]
AVGTRSFVSGDGPVYLFTENGTVKTGWPFRGRGGQFNEAPTLADVDNDDTLEVIIAERLWPGGFLYVLRHDGRVQSGVWPCSLDHVPATGAAVGDLDGDGTVEIVQASYNSLYVLSATGALRPGWPVTMPDNRNWSYQSPALADIDGDDTLEIITAMHKEGGACYVFRHDGTIQPGWPNTYSRWTYCPPTVCDLYRNHDLKVVCGVSAGVSGVSDVAYAYAADGGTLPGFPFVSQTGSNEPNLTVADIDGDGDMEILITSNLITSADSLGYIYALHHDGSQVAGFPLRPWGFTYLNGPNVADVNGDDSLDIVAVSAHGNRLDVTIWETGAPFNRLSWEWPTYQFDMQRTGLYRWAQTGIAETPQGDFRVTNLPTIVRGVLLLSAPATRHSSFGLLNSAGRRVMELLPGPNDVRHLPPGVYFVREATTDYGTASARKVVLTR